MKRVASMLIERGGQHAGVIDALGVWGERWLEVTTEQTDPGFVLWSWARYHLDPTELPAGRVLVEFVFPDEPPTNRRYWLLAEGGSAGLCYSHPGGDPDVYVTAGSEAFTRWHLGTLEWHHGLADGSISVVGLARLARSLPKWNRHRQPMTATA